MSNTIKIRRGSSAPASGVLEEYELGWDYTNKSLYIGVHSSNAIVLTGEWANDFVYNAGNNELTINSSAINIANLNLFEITKEVSSSAVIDAFIYDTALDYDLGIWRDKTENTSWHNETLDTATRGSEQKFPSMVLIVAEVDKVIIYDITDSALTMWMIINSGAGNILSSAGNITKVSALNGLIVIGQDSSGLALFDFIKDEQSNIRSGGTNWHTGTIVNRHTAGTDLLNYWDSGISNVINSVTISQSLINDTKTNLPVSTIIVSTDSGLSTITARNVTNITYTQPNIELVNLNTNSEFTIGHNLYYLHAYNSLPNSDIVEGNAWEIGTADYFYTSNKSITNNVTMHLSHVDNSTIAAISDYSVGLNDNLAIYLPDTNRGMINYITTNFTSGWMQGDIQGAWLASTTVEVIGTDEITDMASSNYTTAPTYDNTTTIISASAFSTATGTTGTRVYLNITTIPNKVYSISMTMDSGSAVPDFSILDGVDGVGTTITDFGSNGGSITYEFVAVSTNITLLWHTLTTQDFAYSAISITGTSNLILNPRFDFDLINWIDSSSAGGSISVLSSELNIINATGTGSAGNLIAIPTTIGKSYALKYNVITGNPKCNIGTTISGSEYISAGEDNYNVFTATTTATYITLYNDSVGTVIIDNILLILVDEDRCFKSTPLEIHGVITKSAIALNSELVSYSGFSSANYLKQQYNADIALSTNDFYIIGHVKSGSANEVLLDYFGNSIIRIDCDGSSNYRVTISDDGLATSDIITTTTVPNSNIYDFICLYRELNTLYLEVNNKEVGSVQLSNAVSSLTGTTEELFIGIKNDLTLPWSGDIALIRFGTSSISQEQREHIYNTEGILFQEGVLCTLAGNDNAIQLLSYDKYTKLLHAGTTEFRSVFRGLKRVQSEGGNFTVISTVNAITAYGA